MYSRKSKKISEIPNYTTSTTPDIYPNYKIIITYDVRSEAHCGYCSDPYDESVETNVVTYTYPLLRIFKKCAINDDNTIDIDCPHLDYYKIETEPHGNGYCGMKTTYNIKHAYIIKDITNDLDD